MEIRVPREDVNDDLALLVRWLAEDGETVREGQVLAMMETSKTVFEIVSPCDGVLRQVALAGLEIEVGSLLGTVGDVAAEPDVPAAAAPAEPPAGQSLTKAARATGLTPHPELQGWVSARDLRPAQAAVRHPRVLLVGAGSVGLQALDILMHDREVRVVGLLDDAEDAARRDLFGFPLLGKFADLLSLFRDQVFDRALITVGLNLKRRLELYELCRSHEIPLANAVDPSVRMNRYASIGQGNILCSFVHLGVDAQLGDNNFVAAHSSLDHHNRIGHHNLFGPGCLLSGTVRVGDRCTFGSGVIVQPNLSIGDDCSFASGTVVLKNVASGETVRLRQ